MLLQKCLNMIHFVHLIHYFRNTALLLSNIIISVTSDAVCRSASTSHLSSSSSGVTDRLANHFIYLQLQIAQDLLTILYARETYASHQFYR